MSFTWEHFVRFRFLFYSLPVWLLLGFMFSLISLNSSWWLCLSLRFYFHCDRSLGLQWIHLCLVCSWTFPSRVPTPGPHVSALISLFRHILSLWITCFWPLFSWSETADFFSSWFVKWHLTCHLSPFPFPALCFLYASCSTVELCKAKEPIQQTIAGHVRLT